MGFRGSEVQRFRVQGSGFKVQGFKVQRFRGSEVRVSGVQGSEVLGSAPPPAKITAGQIKKETSLIQSILFRSGGLKPLRAGINPAPTHETHPKK